MFRKRFCCAPRSCRCDRVARPKRPAMGWEPASGVSACAPRSRFRLAWLATKHFETRPRASLGCAPIVSVLSSTSHTRCRPTGRGFPRRMSRPGVAPMPHLSIFRPPPRPRAHSSRVRSETDAAEARPASAGQSPATRVLTPLSGVWPSRPVGASAASVAVGRLLEWALRRRYEISDAEPRPRAGQCRARNEEDAVLLIRRRRETTPGDARRRPNSRQLFRGKP